MCYCFTDTPTPLTAAVAKQLADIIYIVIYIHMFKYKHYVCTHLDKYLLTHVFGVFFCLIKLTYDNLEQGNDF